MKTKKPKSKVRKISAQEQKDWDKVCNIMEKCLFGKRK